MARRQPKRPRAAQGFLLDENVPREVGDYIFSRGYRVAHVGRDELYLGEAPPKGTPDSLLKKAMQTHVLITHDKRMLEPGRLPGRHRGVFVLDPGDGGALKVVQRLFELMRWDHDWLFSDRRFLVGSGRIEEVELDGTIGTRYL